MDGYTITTNNKQQTAYCIGKQSKVWVPASWIVRVTGKTLEITPNRHLSEHATQLMAYIKQEMRSQSEKIDSE